MSLGGHHLSTWYSRDSIAIWWGEIVSKMSSGCWTTPNLWMWILIRRSGRMKVRIRRMTMMMIMMTGWWFGPFRKIWKSVGMIIPIYGKNKMFQTTNQMMMMIIHWNLHFFHIFSDIFRWCSHIPIRSFGDLPCLPNAAVQWLVWRHSKLQSPAAKFQWSTWSTTTSLASEGGWPRSLLNLAEDWTPVYPWWSA